jgi:putative endonuclease
MQVNLMTYYVYILSSKYKKLYIGVTNNLERRLYEHKNKLIKGFTSKYNIDRLVYYETFSDPAQAISRETQMKDYRREKKVVLIEGMNPAWDDLSASWDKTSGDSSLRSE